MNIEGVLNLDGINTRYEKPREVVAQIAGAGPEQATKLVQELYRKPIKEDLIAQRIKEIKAAKVPCAVSTIPQNAEKYGETFKKELARVLIHGILHILGYDHEKKDGKMIEKQEYYLSRF